MKTLIAARRLTLEDLQRVYVSDTPHDPWTAKQVYEQLRKVLAQPKGKEYTTPEGVSVITLQQHYQRVAWGGRHFARDSTQQLWKPIRAHLHRQLTMIDIATCAPSVLVWLLGDLCAVDCLKYYRDKDFLIEEPDSQESFSSMDMDGAGEASSQDTLSGQPVRLARQLLEYGPGRGGRGGERPCA